MIELEVNTKNLLTFLNNIRKEDLAELYFIADDCGFPLAIGGVKKICFRNFKIGQVWFLCSNEFEKNKISALRYIKNKLNYFKDDYDFLFNFIYKSNFKFLKWLKRVHFTVVDKDNDLKLFYYSKGDINFDLRYITGK